MDALTRLYRRVMMIVGRGRITTTDDTGPVQITQVRLGADELRDQTPRLAEYGFTSFPQPGADAVVVFLGGDRSNGCIIATGDRRFRLTSLAPGEVALYDDLDQAVHLTRTGIVVSSPTKIRFAAPEIEIHATTSFRWDVNGHGQHWFPTKVDTWQTGETPGTAHPISPPEIA